MSRRAVGGAHQVVIGTIVGDGDEREPVPSGGVLAGEHLVAGHVKLHRADSAALDLDVDQVPVRRQRADVVAWVVVGHLLGVPAEGPFKADHYRY